MTITTLAQKVRDLGRAMETAEYHMQRARECERRGNVDEARYHRVEARQAGAVECGLRHDLRKAGWRP